MVQTCWRFNALLEYLRCRGEGRVKEHLAVAELTLVIYRKETHRIYRAVVRQLKVQIDEKPRIICVFIGRDRPLRSHGAFDVSELEYRPNIVIIIRVLDFE